MRNFLGGRLGTGKRGWLLAAALAVLCLSPLRPQDAAPAPAVQEKDDPADFLGLTLAELLERFGPPSAVRAVRGIEEWQDDVVFAYPPGDFYLYKNRVWQVSVSEAGAVRTGDNKMVALLALGDAVTDNGDYLTYDIPGRSWPITLRCNLDKAGKITAIFLYRPDY